MVRSAVGVAALAAAAAWGVVATVPPSRSQEVNQAAVEIWTNRDEVFRSGDEVRVYVRSPRNGYLTVLRVDTDGGVRMMMPLSPWDNNYVRGGRRYEIRGPDVDYAFLADASPGLGYLFVVASPDPFDYAELVSGDRWDYRFFADGGRITGDPYVALMDVVDTVVPAGYGDYGYDVLPYNVERVHAYPRFLCYDCHRYTPYPYWDPYGSDCTRVRIVVYDDPSYDPAGAYGSMRIVSSRPDRLEPRYVIREQLKGEPYVVHDRRRRADGGGGGGGVLEETPPPPRRWDDDLRRAPERPPDAVGRRGAPEADTAGRQLSQPATGDRQTPAKPTLRRRVPPDGTE